MRYSIGYIFFVIEMAWFCRNWYRIFGREHSLIAFVMISDEGMEVGVNYDLPKGECNFNLLIVMNCGAGTAEKLSRICPSWTVILKL